MEQTGESQTDEVQAGERLQSYLAHCGVASRRRAEDIIADGRVMVNGIVIMERGTRVLDTDVVMVDGEVVKPEAVKRYVLLNKPSGYVCSSSDEKGRDMAVDLLREAYTERLYNVGRLDMWSTGLIIFTNDGNFAARMAHPSAQIEKEYIVKASVNIPRKVAEDFEKGVRIDDVFYRCKTAASLNARKMRIVLVEGKNREIRRVFEAYNVGIKTLERVRIGNITKGELKVGQWRDLTTAEVADLMEKCKQQAS